MAIGGLTGVAAFQCTPTVTFPTLAQSPTIEPLLAIALTLHRCPGTNDNSTCCGPASVDENHGVALALGVAELQLPTT
jgi:hypothetical protein